MKLSEAPPKSRFTQRATS